MDYYETLLAIWPNHRHRYVIDWVEPESQVLDLGCGDGKLGRCLVQRKRCKVTGIDADADLVRTATRAGLNAMCANLEYEATLGSLSQCYDVIIMADVLEHLVSPWSALRACHALLKPGGCVLVSLPNVAHFSMRLRLMFGQFEYTDHGGLRDRGHLRFFTYHSARQLFAQAGYRVDGQHYRWRFHGSDYGLRLHWVLRRLVTIAPNMLAYQMIFRLIPDQKTGGCASLGS